MNHFIVKCHGINLSTNSFEVPEDTCIITVTATGVSLKDLIVKNNIQLFISGHSHILKVMYDEKTNCLHMNPGAAGKQGWHKTKTLIRFVIDAKDMKDCEVIELA